MYITRRKFLANTSAVTAATLVGNLGTWGVESARAQAADYKALVCLFFFGGNDANNMVVPYDDYSQYSAVRTAASNIALTQASLLQINNPVTGKKYGLHPNLPALQTIYNSGQMAVIANAGTLLAPTTLADYKAGKFRPPNLFSHSDQQYAWMGQMPGVVVRTGWAGRASDKLKSANTGALIPTTVSVSGNQVFGVGNSTVPFVIPSTGGVNLQGQNNADPVANARFTALRSLLLSGTGNTIVDSAAAVMDSALTAAAAANPILAATPAVVTNAFVNPANPVNQLNTGLANQFKQVARLIEARGALGTHRQFFMVNIGGFDTHSNELAGQGGLMTQINDAVNAFYKYTVAAGVDSMVTTFTMSDFSRTFIGNANAGTDHAYGAHHFVLGGAVKGGKFYGTFPQLVPKGPDDSGSNGSWLPTTSVDQIGGTLASWFGMPAADIDYTFPNLTNFGTKNLGFV
jgi:uncharacterized protein (DUF1501 family)